MTNILEVLINNWVYGVGAVVGAKPLYHIAPFLFKKIKGVKSMYIHFDDINHSFVCGTTGTGKTFGASHSLQHSKKGVLFFNTVGTDSVPSSFSKATPIIDINLIDELLSRGRKVNFIPTFNRDRRDAELETLISYYLNGKKRDFIFAIDEVHLYRKKAKESVIELATTGRNFGIKGVYISQRPANVENQLLEMCSQWAIYYTPLSPGWFNNYNMPGDIIVDNLEKSPKYSYMLYRTPKDLKGPFRVTL